MAYSEIVVPFDVPLREMTKGQLGRYALWFRDAMEVRIGELSREVARTGGDWSPDRSVESLAGLDRWLEGQVGTESPSAEEVAREQAWLAPGKEVPRRLDVRTSSLVFDVGMYFGAVVVANVAGTAWGQVLKNRRNFDYGHVVVTGFGLEVLNPVWIAKAVCLAIGNGGPQRFAAVFRVWQDRARVQHAR